VLLCFRQWRWILLPDDLHLPLQPALVIAFPLTVSLRSLIPLVVPEFLLLTTHFDVIGPLRYVAPLPLTYHLLLALASSQL
jgi:hypothetical protein